MDREFTVKVSRIPILNPDSHEQWFRRMRLRLEGKDIFYTTKISKEAFAWNGKLVESKTAPEGSKDAQQIQKISGGWDTEKVAQYKKDQAKLFSILTDHLSEDDQNSIDEFGTAVEVWAHLKKKYAKTSVNAANTYLDRIQNF
ncbi:hypothetical protein K3495_g11130 [Podosphaera aphanis]|nr:hypothetical protein K3495_g11130 [Podosphaera aphanis]